MHTYMQTYIHTRIHTYNYIHAGDDILGENDFRLNY